MIANTLQGLVEILALKKRNIISVVKIENLSNKNKTRQTCNKTIYDMVKKEMYSWPGIEPGT